jgi:hypothetical protein
VGRRTASVTEDEAAKLVYEQARGKDPERGEQRGNRVFRGTELTPNATARNSYRSHRWVAGAETHGLAAGADRIRTLSPSTGN